MEDNYAIILSVIIPVYNCEKYIDDCLNSLFIQTVQCMEIICVDDNSDDGSFERMKNLKYKFGDMHIIKNKKRHGSSYSRNRGLAIAKGKYIYFLDADDYLKCNNALEMMIRAAESNDVDLVCFDKTDVIYEDSDCCTKYSNNRVLEQNIEEGLYNREEYFAKFVMSKKRNYAPWEQLWRRSFLELNKLLFNESIIVAEDVLFTFQGLLKANKVYHMKDCLYVYRIRNNSSINSSNNIDRIIAHLRCYRECVQFIEKINNINQMYDLIYRFLNELEYIVYINSIDMLKRGVAISIIERGFSSLSERYIYSKIIMKDFSALNSWITPCQIRAIKSMKKKLIIYGDGLISIDVKKMLRAVNIHEDYTAVTYPSDIQKARGVIPISNLRELSEEVTVIVAASRVNVDEMIKELNKINIYNYFIIN